MKAKKLNQVSGMPQMLAAFSNWMISITLIRITQTINEGFVVDSERTFTFQGTVQPLSPQQLLLKPEGLRSFEWLDVHVLTSSLDLVTNDLIKYNNKKYKIMATNDYTLNNYVEYHLVENFEVVPDA